MLLCGGHGAGPWDDDPLESSFATTRLDCMNHMSPQQLPRFRNPPVQRSPHLAQPPSPPGSCRDSPSSPSFLLPSPASRSLQFAQPSRLCPPSRPDLLPATPSIRVPPAKNRKHPIMSMRKKWADPSFPGSFLAGLGVKQAGHPASLTQPTQTQVLPAVRNASGQASNRQHGVFCPEMGLLEEGIVVLSRPVSPGHESGEMVPVTSLTRRLGERRRPRCSEGAAFRSLHGKGKHRVHHPSSSANTLCALWTPRVGRLGLGSPAQAPSMMAGPLFLHRIDLAPGVRMREFLRYGRVHRSSISKTFLAVLFGTYQR